MSNKTLDDLINIKAEILEKLKAINNNKNNEAYKNLKNEYIKVQLKIRYLTNEDYRNFKKDYRKTYYINNKANLNNLISV